MGKSKAYFAISSDDGVPHADYSLFDNGFDEVLQIIAYAGTILDAVIGTGRPSDLALTDAFLAALALRSQRT